MAASLFVEVESGSYIPRFEHPHNGYYAGDFFQTSPVRSTLFLARRRQVVHQRRPAVRAAREL
jgi:hypothetical protein